jgi:phosphoribosylformylglycinamidine synthase
MRIAILVFPGSNCERETMLAVRRAGMTPVEVLWNEPPETLASFDGYILAGGFSYEDRGRAGVIAAHLPIMDAIRQQSELGKPVLGICNGAQILIESGLVPGLPHQKIALTDNQRIQQGNVLGTGFYNAWVTLKLSEPSKPNAFTRLMNQNTLIHLPAAHAEGRFLIPEPLLSQVKQGLLTTFQYCDEQGEVINEFPINPNGSDYNIAALCNEAGNVMAMMPHPERTPKGDCLFQSMRDYIASGCQLKPTVMAANPNAQSKPVIPPFAKDTKKYELIVELLINDNHALTVEHTLKRLGIPATVTRQIRWQIDCDSEETLEKIKASGVIYNEQKERLTSHQSSPQKKSFLVRSKEDLQGLQKVQTLRRHLDLKGVHSIERSVLWHVQAPQGQLDAVVERVLDTSLLFNPVSHECLSYV